MASVGSSAVLDDNKPKTGLARKMTCPVTFIDLAGIVLILIIQVYFTLTTVDDWGAETRGAMIELEQANLLKLASAKAEFVSEQFGRVEESILQLQAFAEQAVLAVPETMTVDSYLTSYSGLLQSSTTLDHSVWYIPDLPTGEVPEAGGSLESLLNRSS
ncbi:unnamed protein product, partial [Ectocarpus sp. 12 AP-2014]